MLLVPKDECEVVDTWFASGLAGTGSKDIVAEGNFVPEHRVLDANVAGSSDMSAWELHRQVSYRVPLRVTLGWELIAPVVGFGEAAIEDFLGRIRGTSGRARSAEGTQMQIGSPKPLWKFVQRVCSTTQPSGSSWPKVSEPRPSPHWSEQVTFVIRRSLSNSACRQSIGSLT
jgi:hypothetical protein